MCSKRSFCSFLLGYFEGTSLATQSEYEQKTAHRANYVDNAVVGE